MNEPQIQPLVSIVLPVYNVEPYLKDCLDSIKRLTIDDFELICINDGSTDGSAKILDAYAGEISQMQVIHQANTGAYATRNRALRLVTGKYVWMIDADDVFEPDAVRKACCRAVCESADIVIIGWDYLPPFETRSPDIASWNLVDWTDYPKSLFPLHFGYLWMKFYRTDFLRQHGLDFCEKYYSKTDVIFHWKSMSLAETVCYLPEPLYHYRIHENSITGTIGEKFTQMVDVMEMARSELLAIGDPKQLLSGWLVFALTCIRSAHRKIPAVNRVEMEGKIRGFLSRLDEHELKILTGPDDLPTDLRQFYLSLQAGETASYSWLRTPMKDSARNLLSRLIPTSLRSRFVEFLSSQSYALSQSNESELRLSIKELSNTVDRLSAEVCRLRRKSDEQP